MKKSIFISVIAIVALLSACKKGAQVIVGSWAVAECSISNLEDLKKKQLLGTPDSLIGEYTAKLEEEIKQFMDETKKQTFEFQKDSFNITRSDGKNTGTWKMSSDGKVLFLITAEARRSPIDAFSIIAMDANELKLSTPLNSENPLVYTLKKQ
jgi:hypothetical protein